MLISRELLNRATELTLADIRAALSTTGYGNLNDLRDARFLGMDPTGSFVYEISYDEGEEELSRGNIYIRFRRGAFGKNFEFAAEF